MPYDQRQLKGKTFVGAPVPDALHHEFARLCKLAGRSKAKELETSVSIRVKQLQQQERQGTIRGIR